jgi:hypothetical protein
MPLVPGSRLEPCSSFNFRFSYIFAHTVFSVVVFAVVCEDCDIFTLPSTMPISDQRTGAVVEDLSNQSPGS